MNSVSGVNNVRTLLLWVLFCSMHLLVYAQQGEVELKEKADKLFEEEKYIDATPMYSQLVALNPRLADYQFRFGTCLLYNSYKKQDAFKYLNYAVTDPTIDVRAYYFLGKAYHLTYQFNEAIKNYELYKQKCGGKPRASYEVDRQIEMCQNGKRLLTTISDLVVLEKREYSAKEFFRLYKLQDIGGDIIVAADYQSKIDKKKGFVPIIHFPADSKAIYYASYGDSDTGQKDIYVRKKLPDGSWSLPQPVQGNVNTPYDEDFPYMHPGGEYLYFSSKGHNSMGGYDIFRSKFNPENNSFGPPENMDFAITSPDNDLFFIVDSLDNNAWFASSRQSSNGNVHVYRVRVDRVPLQLAVVKGSFASSVRPENKKISITVTDFASGEKVGTFASNEKGSYLITFPKGGKYTYEMKVEGSTATHKYVVSIPFLKEFKPLKQKILEETVESSEVVRVIDLFNEEVEDPMGVLAEVIKMRSELNPNADQFDLEELDVNKENSKILAELGFEDATPGAVISVFEQLEDKQEEKVKTSENLSQGALTQASDKLTEAVKLQDNVKTLVNQANAATDKGRKFELLSQAQDALQKTEDLKESAQQLIHFSDSIDKESVKDKEQLEILKAVTVEVRKDVTSGNLNDLKEVVTGNAALIKEVKDDQTANPLDALAEERTQLKKERQSLDQQKGNFETTGKQLESEIDQLKKDLAAAKAKDQPGIQSKIDSKTNELAMVNEQITSLDKKIAKVVGEENAVNDQIAFLQDVTAVNPNASVTSQQVQQQLSAVDSKNNNTLSAYVDMQVKELKKDPEIQALATQDNQDPVVEDLSDNYEKRINAANSAGSPREKQEQLLAADREAETAIDKALDETEEQLAKNPNDQKAQDRKKQLTELKQQAENNTREHEAALASLPADNGTTITPEQELEALSPNHTEKLKNIDKGSPEATLTAQNDLDKELIADADRELTKVNNQLTANPGDKKASERKKALEQVKNDANERIADREELVASLNTNNDGISAENELEALSPNHTEKMKSIDKGSPEATLNAQNDLDKELIADADRELAKVNDQLTADPGYKKASERKKAIEQVKNDANERILEREERLAALPANSGNQISPENELETLSPGHEDKLATIDEGTPKATLEARNVIDEELINQVNSELEDVEGQLLRNPNNEEAKQRQTALNTVKEQAQSRIDERKEEIAGLDNQSEPTTNVLATATQLVRPEHADNLSTIEATMEDGSKKEQAKLKEENNLLTDLKKELDKTEAALTKDPGNEQLKEQVKTLTEAVELQESLISEREQDLVAIEKAAIGKDNFVKEIMPAYNQPDVPNREKYSEKEIADLTKQEQQLRDKLVARLRANEKKLARGFDPKLAAENKVITELMEQSLNREQTLNSPVTEDPLVAERIAEDLGEEHALLMESDPTTVDEAKSILTGLHEYEDKLEEQLRAAKTDPDGEEKATEIEAQLKTVRKRIGIIEVDLDEMESSATIAENPGETAAEKELKQLTQAEKELENRVADPRLTSTEKKTAEKELTAVRKQLAEQEALVQQEELAETKETRKTSEARLENLPSGDPLVEAVKERNNTLTAENVENPTKTPVETQIRNEERAIQLADATADFVPVKTTYEEEGIVAETPASLAETKRRFLIEIGQLEAVIETAEKDPKRADEVTKLRQQRDVLKAAVADIEAMEAVLTAEKVPQPVVKEGLDTPLSYEEEVKLSSAPEYPALLQQQANIQTTRGNLAAVIREKEQAREAVSSAQTPAEREQAIERLRDLTAQENTLRTQLETQEATLQTALEQTPNKAGYENLLAREVAPSKPIVASTEILPTLGDGFELVQQPGTVRTEKVLQVGTKPPSGLVYRVQVGAYARPIPEDLFKEFTPVTGEPLNNGITRYLAGYFGNRNRAIEAQGQIRGLGYNDAFVVAYCDGNRITLAEARRLEDLGLCVPKNQDSLLMEVVENTLAQLPPDSAARLRPTPKPDDYNKAPGAAVADAAEVHKGLYYTVQVGVYNRPVPASQVKNIEPLVTKRLENGQIRYSSGMFHSVQEARPKRAEAVERGITDAFITAYYNGERITLDEARRLLEENGVAILEPKPTVVPADAIDQARLYAQSQPPTPKETHVQFVSTERYTVYPREELANLNMHGSFYYDATDGKIKSVEYLQEEALSRATTLLKSMDTVEIVQNSPSETEPKTPSVVAEWDNAEMTGAMADWLLRLAQPHVGTRTENGFRLTFEAVAEVNREALTQQLYQFGARSVKVAEEIGSDNR